MQNTLQGKTIVVAGGAAGAGLAFSSLAAANGATVHILGRSTERLSKAKATHPNIKTHVIDITNGQAVKAVAEAIGEVDHIVATAADLAFKPFVELTDEDILKSLGAKVWGPIYLTRYFAPQISKSGSITFVSGSAAYKATPGGSAVAAANAALDGLARTLAVELAPVRVNVVSPGVFDGSTWDFLDASSRKSTLDSIGTGLPVGRVGTAEEIADAIHFLVNNRFATGTVLAIDGGANA